MDRAAADIEDRWRGAAEQGLATPSLVLRWAAKAHVPLSAEHAEDIARFLNFFGTARAQWQGAEVAAYAAREAAEHRADVEAMIRVAQRAFGRGDTASGNAALELVETEKAILETPSPSGRPVRLETQVRAKICEILSTVAPDAPQWGRDALTQICMQHLGVKGTDAAVGRGRRRQRQRT